MNQIAMQAELQRVQNIVNQMKATRQTIGPVEDNYDSVTKKVVVFTEDSGSGYNFYKVFIEKCYPLARVDIVSLGGHGGIKYIPNYISDSPIEYNNIIIIYDRGRSSGQKFNDNNRKDIPRVVNKLKKINGNMKIYIFSPLCFESVPLSFRLLINTFLSKYNITESQYTSLHKELVELISGEVENINWLTYVNSGMSVENIIEQAIFEITKNTEYQVSHYPSYISECWTKECSNQCIDINAHCNLINLSDYDLARQYKLELIAANSVLGGLSYIFDKIYNGIQFRSYPLAIANNSSYKSMLIQEA